MEPNKKALQLVNKFKNEVGMYHEEAIRSSLILVSEILDLGYVPGEKSSYNVYKYYCDVKLALIKLQKNGIKA